MAARSLWNGTIAFGEVAIPVKLFAATEDHRIHFREVRLKDGCRIEHRLVGARLGPRDPARADREGVRDERRQAGRARRRGDRRRARLATEGDRARALRRRRADRPGLLRPSVRRGRPGGRRARLPRPAGRAGAQRAASASAASCCARASSSSRCARAAGRCACTRCASQTRSSTAPTSDVPPLRTRAVQEGGRDGASGSSTRSRPTGSRAATEIATRADVLELIETQGVGRGDRGAVVRDRGGAGGPRRGAGGEPDSGGGARRKRSSSTRRSKRTKTGVKAAQAKARRRGRSADGPPAVVRDARRSGSSPCRSAGQRRARPRRPLPRGRRQEGQRASRSSAPAGTAARRSPGNRSATATSSTASWSCSPTRSWPRPRRSARARSRSRSSSTLDADRPCALRPSLLPAAAGGHRGRRARLPAAARRDGGHRAGRDRTGRAALARSTSSPCASGTACLRSRRCCSPTRSATRARSTRCLQAARAHREEAR